MIRVDSRISSSRGLVTRGFVAISSLLPWFVFFFLSPRQHFVPIAAIPHPEAFHLEPSVQPSLIYAYAEWEIGIEQSWEIMPTVVRVV